MRAPVVAIIDDDESVREAVAHLISSQGYRTEVYASAEDFIGHVMKSEASCVLADVHLKDLSGIELTRHLSWLGLALPVILMTAADAQSLRKQAMELGCIAYLRKPLCQRLLFEAITEGVGCGHAPRLSSGTTRST
jgi:FixJ family two-component response regulator